MLGYYPDIHRSFRVFNQLRREMDRVLDEARPMAAVPWAEATAPRATVRELDDAYEVSVDLPGVRPDDVEISLEGSVLTLSAKRSDDVPTGHSVRRRERAAFQFSRSFRFAGKVEADSASAKLEHGVLTLRIGKAPELQPRRIPVEVK